MLVRDTIVRVFVFHRRNDSALGIRPRDHSDSGAFARGGIATFGSDKQRRPDRSSAFQMHFYAVWQLHKTVDTIRVGNLKRVRNGGSIEKRGANVAIFRDVA